MLLIPIQSVHPPKGGTSCDYGIYPSCSHLTPNWELHWVQPARIYIFTRLFSLFTPCLFFWLSLTQLQLFHFNLFLHKGPGVNTLISRGCFQRCLLAFSRQYLIIFGNRNEQRNTKRATVFLAQSSVVRTVWLSQSWSSALVRGGLVVFMTGTKSLDSALLK